MHRSRANAVTSGERLKHLLTVLCVCFAQGCDSPTGPSESIRIAIAAPSAPAYTVERDYYEEATFRCDVVFTATATGKGVARWDGVTLRRFAGADWRTPLDTVSYTADEIGAIWSRDSLRAGEFDRSPWRFEAEVPFKITALFHWRSRGGARRASSSTFTCGPTIPETTSPPELTVLEVRTSDPVPEAGDTLFVRYRAASTALLTRTGVLLRGAFAAAQWFAEPFPGSVERTVAFVIPRLARLDSTVAILLRSNDGAGRRPEVRSETPILLRDVTPPTLSGVWTVGGQRPTQSGVEFFVTANDAHDLHRIVWQVGGADPRTDSVTIGDEGSPHTESITIMVPQSWVGPSPPISFLVRDRVGLSSGSITIAAGTYEFYPTVPGAVAVGEFASGNGTVPHVEDVVYDARRNRLYTAHTFSGYVGAMDLNSMTSLAPIAMPNGAHSLDLTLSGDSLLIGNVLAPELAVIDLVTWTRRASIPIPLLDSIGTALPGARPRPTGVRVAANGMVVIKTHVASAAGDNVFTLDLATGVARARSDARPATAVLELWWPRLYAPPGRGRVVILDPACARVYRAISDDFGGCTAGIPAPYGSISASVDGQRLLIGTKLVGPDLSPIGEVTETDHAVPHPDGQHLIVSRSGVLYKIRLADGRVVSRLVVSNSSLDRVMLLPNGQTALVFGSSNGAVFRVDISALL